MEPKIDVVDLIHVAPFPCQAIYTAKNGLKVTHRKPETVKFKAFVPHWDAPSMGTQAGCHLTSHN